MKRLLIVAIVSVMFFSCATKISNIKNSPEKFAGQTVNVKGEVTKLIKIPFTDYSFFEISDKSDNLTVFSLNDHIKGDVITFRAKVVGFDSTDQNESTIKVIAAVEDFILKNIKIEKSKVNKTAEAIGNALSKALNASSATYFLIEQSK